MPNLTPSFRGDNYTREQKREMWLDIHTRGKCPECGAIDSMLKGPRGGLGTNITCSQCNMVFWTSSIYGFGAYPISSEAKKGG